jgi:NAD-dependent SIR2 family protein deacetylase
MRCQKCENEIEGARVERFAAKGKTPRYCETCGKRLLRNARARQSRAMRAQVYADCGLVRVVVNGRTFWE